MTRSRKSLAKIAPVHQPEPAPLQIADLTPDPANRRAHNPRNLGMITEALAQVGAARSIVIDEHNVILAGNGVVEAAGAAGLTRLRIVEADGQELIAVRRTGLTDAQKRHLALADNRGAELATWNLDQLAADLQNGEDLSAFFYDEELKTLLAGPNGVKAGRTDPDEVPPERPTAIQSGDLFELGQHRLLCGDSTSASAVARLIGDVKVDAIVTDPPYGVGVDYGSFADTEANVRALMAKVMPALLGMGVPVVLTPGIPAMWSYPRPTWLLAWVHPAPTGGCPWGFGGLNPILAYGADPYLQAGLGRRPDHIVAATDRAGVEGHPTPKPIKVWAWLVERVTPKAAMVVFDPFGGSGTTLIACEQLGRRARWFFDRFTEKGACVVDLFLGSGSSLIAAEQTERRCFAVELDPSYCQVILDRWEAFTGLKALKVGEALHA